MVARVLREHETMRVIVKPMEAMSEQHEPISVQVPLLDQPRGARADAWSGAIAVSRDGLRDTIAGLVASVVLIANIVSFGALMFPGELAAGIPTAIWAMLIGGCIGGICIALATSLPPLATGIDSPTGAVLVLLSAAAGSNILATGGTPEMAVQTVMLIFTAATVLTGATAVWSRHMPLGHVFPVCALFRRRRISGRDRRVPDRRRHSHDGRNAEPRQPR